MSNVKTKEKSKGIKFDKRESMVKDCKIVRFGIYEAEIEADSLIYTTAPVSTIDENMFYKIYLQLNNVVRFKRSGVKIIDMKLTDAPMELMAHIMCKGPEYTLVYRNKDSKLQDIADELGRTVTSVYTSMGKLRTAGYLINTEDGLCAPNNECLDLVKKTQASIKDKGHLAYNYMFKFCVANSLSNVSTLKEEKNAKKE